VTPIENPKSQITNPTELLPLSLLNDYLYCPRRAALKIVEGWREENKHTVLGDIVHEHADLPGYESQISNLKSEIRILRALPVFSDRLGLNGKCDIVEVELRSEIGQLRCPEAGRIQKRQAPPVRERRRATLRAGVVSGRNVQTSG
jgi:CRISPR-associated exonuclease Cas4